MSIAEKLLTIAENEQRVYDAGFEAGKAQGGGGDTEAAYQEGKDAAWNEFWDAIQWKGTRNTYNYAFSGAGWNGNIFYPKYYLIITNGQNAFADFDGGKNPFSLVDRLNELGLAFDTSNSASFSYMFSRAPFTDMPFFDTRKCSGFGYAFYSCSHLETLSMALKDDGSQTWSNTFWRDYALKNLTITSGAIGKNGFGVQWSTFISKESLLSILNACKINVVGQGISITLPEKCIDGATDTEALLSETGDADLYSASMAARSNGYTITFTQGG